MNQHQKRKTIIFRNFDNKIYLLLKFKCNFTTKNLLICQHFFQSKFIIWCNFQDQFCLRQPRKIYYMLQLSLGRKLFPRCFYLSKNVSCFVEKKNGCSIKINWNFRRFQLFTITKIPNKKFSDPFFNANDSEDENNWRFLDHDFN
jgi:hypothetical protein